MSAEQPANLDSIIERLLEGASILSFLLTKLPFSLCVARTARPGKPVQMTEGELKYLCVKAKQIFLEQPVLLELEAPIKICGNIGCGLCID